MSLNVPDLVAELRTFQEAWGLVAVSAVADTPNGQVKVTVGGDKPVVAIQNQTGAVFYPEPTDD